MLEFRFVSFHLGSCCTFCSHFVLAECAYFLRKPTQLWGTAPFILRALEYLSQHDLLQRAIFGLMVSVFGWKGSCQVSFLRSALVGGVCDFYLHVSFFVFLHLNLRFLSRCDQSLISISKGGFWCGNQRMSASQAYTATFGSAATSPDVFLARSALVFCLDVAHLLCVCSFG